MTDTQLAQMALSAIIRCEEKIDIVTLSEVLRGQNSRAVKVLGLAQIKTFGVGREWSKDSWFYMLIQMLQQDLFEIDYKNNYLLKVTEIGRNVLKGEREVSFADHEISTPHYHRRRTFVEQESDDNIQEEPMEQKSKGLTFRRNGIVVRIEPELSEAIAWREVVQSIGSKIYWNYQGDMWLNVSKYVPSNLENREQVKSRLIEILKEVYKLELTGDSFFVPKKEDLDNSGKVVEPLSLPFDECLRLLREFLTKNGRYPSMKADAEEVALRKWYREAWHRIIPISNSQKIQLMQLREEFPFNVNE